MPEPVYKTIGAIIRTKRRRLEWSQLVLASRLGISRAALANIETGRQRILVHQLYALAEAFQIKPSELLPAAVDNASPSKSKTLEIQGELNPRQIEQIARLVGLKPTTIKQKQRTNAKAEKRSFGNSG